MMLRHVEARSIANRSTAALAAVLAPRMALADEKAVDGELKKLYGDKKMASGKIKLDIPQIAENGLVVPVNVEVESPMTDDDYVKTVHVFADGNPLPGVVSYRSRRHAARRSPRRACVSPRRRTSSASPRCRMASSTSPRRK